MSSFMSSTFTTSDRKKKGVTYGKSARPPSTRPSPIYDDAPSPDRPNKHAAASRELLAGSKETSKSAQAPTGARIAANSRDEFDVPSEDEFEFLPTMPAKRSTIQRSTPKGKPSTKVSSSIDDVVDPPALTAARAPQKPIVARTVQPKKAALGNKAHPRQVAQDKAAFTVMHNSAASQTKALRAAEDQKEAVTAGQRLQRPKTLSKNTSRANSPGLSVQSLLNQQAVTTVPTASLGKTARPTMKPSSKMDIFDVPSGNEAASIPIPRAPSQTFRQALKAKTVEASNPSLHETAQEAQTKTNNLGSFQIRKRKASMSLTSAPKSVHAHLQEISKQHRDPKVAKRAEESSRGCETIGVPHPRPASQTTAAEPPVSKPRRTRTNTVPVVSHPTMSKGQSSPAVLNRMIPVKQASRTSLEDTGAEMPASDDTMYDIADVMSTPARPTPLRRTISSTPGSVTPRQKDLFSTLLGSPAAPKTPASALASLQLTNKKPKSLLGALAKSRSDLSLSSKSRNARPLSTLQDRDASSEEDDSESDDDIDTTAVLDIGMDIDKTPVQTKRSIVASSNAIDREVKDTSTADSQSSQLTSGAVTRPKLTYASQRSYLQETNTEEEFLMSMDLDDGLKMESQTISTDDEDGPTSQPRTHHELKKYGQNTVFSWDMEESIHEISLNSDKSTRRSAMTDLCTKLADAGFVSQLLDSGFMHKLLENMISSGDVIFDFTACLSILFVLHTKPALAIVDQVYKSGVTTTLIRSMIYQDADISRIARDRKSNMSKIARDSLTELRALVLASSIWSSSALEKISPQLLVLHTADMLTRSLRESGSTEALLTPIEVSEIVDVCLTLSKRVKTTNCSATDILALDLAISTLETVSIGDQSYVTWPLTVLQNLSDSIPAFFQDKALSQTVEAMKLCMHLTNNKPKSCQPFSTQAFVGSLINFIEARFVRLDSGELSSEHRTRVLAELTLSLGTMINLAELSDQARLNAVTDTTSIEVLVRTFITGSERAGEASSVEESEVSVVIGFLAVLLGMLCLNTAVRSQIQIQLPDRQLRLLLDTMKQFARIHERVDKRTASRFDGSEGQEALNDYYVRIMHVVTRLESAKA